MADVTVQLEVEGVKAFADSLDSLVETLRAKRSELMAAQA